jgi:hypothetical protein
MLRSEVRTLVEYGLDPVQVRYMQRIFNVLLTVHRDMSVQYELFTFNLFQ